MIRLRTIEFIPKKRKRTATPDSPISNAPVLIAAVYSEVDLFIQLTFDRAIDFSDFDGTQISVFDPVDNNQWFRATGNVSSVSADSLEAELVSMGAYSGETIHLDATALSGIVALYGGGAWNGVMGLVLPFP